MVASTKQETLARGLQRLFEVSRPELIRRLSIVEEAVNARNDGVISDDLREQAHFEAHKLAGVLGTFGKKDASRSAYRLEMMFEGNEQLETTDTHEHIHIIRGALQE